jgi:hypothetical protein
MKPDTISLGRSSSGDARDGGNGQDGIPSFSSISSIQITLENWPPVPSNVAKELMAYT